MIRLSSTQLHLLIRLTYNEAVFHTRKIRKSPQHILVASFTQSSVFNNDIKKSTPFGDEDKKVKEDQLNEETDNSEHVVIDKLKPILKDNDDNDDNDMRFASKRNIIKKFKFKQLISFLSQLFKIMISRFKKITDPNEIKESVFSIVQKYIDSAKGDLMQLELKDAKLKFEVKVKKKKKLSNKFY
jgi:hypothetical protein